MFNRKQINRPLAAAVGSSLIGSVLIVIAVLAQAAMDVQSYF